MTPRDRRLLGDMLKNAVVAMDNSGGVDAAVFDETPPLKYTTPYALLIVGEAASKLSPEVKARLPSTPWDEIVRTRHVIAHGYDKIDPEVILGITADDLPPLVKAIGRLLAAEGNDTP